MITPHESPDGWEVIDHYATQIMAGLSQAPHPAIKRALQMQEHHFRQTIQYYLDQGGTMPFIRA